MMNRIRLLMINLRHRDEGASAVEYGLLVAGIALVVLAGAFFLGGVVNDQFNEVGTAIEAG